MPQRPAPAFRLDAPAEEPAATLPKPEDFSKSFAPETAPVPKTAGAMTTALGAAVERAVTHAVEMNGEAPRDAAARQALEVAAVQEIATQLRAEVEGDFVAAASVLPGRVLDATVRSLEGKSAETLGANLGEGILAAGRELQPKNPEAAEAVAGPPRRDWRWRGSRFGRSIKLQGGGRGKQRAARLRSF